MQIRSSGSAGALAGEGASKGLFISTGHFSEGARDYVRNLSTVKTKIVLVDGQQLAQLIIEYDFGVAVRTTYERAGSAYRPETESRARCLRAANTRGALSADRGPRLPDFRPGYPMQGTIPAPAASTI